MGIKKRTTTAPTRVNPPTVRTERERRKASPGQLNYVPGSDMYVVFEELQRGGPTRAAVNARITKRFEGQVTSGGKPKPVTTLMNVVLKRAMACGWQVEGMWKLVPPYTGQIPEDVPRVSDGIARPTLAPLFLPPAKPDADASTPVRVRPRRAPRTVAPPRERPRRVV